MRRELGSGNRAIDRTRLKRNVIVKISKRSVSMIRVLIRRMEDVRPNLFARPSFFVIFGLSNQFLGEAKFKLLHNTIVK